MIKNVVQDIDDNIQLFINKMFNRRDNKKYVETQGRQAE